MTSGGTASFRAHLKKKHKIDLVGSSVALKRQLDGTAVDIALRRAANRITEEKETKRRKDLFAISLDKLSIEYLFI